MDTENEKNVILIDEDGTEIEFKCLDYIELNSKKYVVLAETLSDNEEEVVILQLVTENDEDSFLTIEDDEEIESVFEEFKNRMVEEE